MLGRGHQPSPQFAIEPCSFGEHVQYDRQLEHDEQLVALRSYRRNSRDGQRIQHDRFVLGYRSRHPAQRHERLLIV
jgi:hypothetical protein